MRFLLHPVVLFLLGALSGVLGKVFDIVSYELSDIFSDLTIWILFGTLIAYYSSTGKKAVRNVFLFFVGMLLAYYATAMVTHMIYGKDIALSWLVIACFISLLAYPVWLAGKTGFLPMIIRIGVTAACVASAAVFTNDSLTALLLNLLIVGTLIYHLWIRNRPGKRARRR